MIKYIITTHKKNNLQISGVYVIIQMRTIFVLLLSHVQKESDENSLSFCIYSAFALTMHIFCGTMNILTLCWCMAAEGRFLWKLLI